jgi:hypothetical protein
VEAWVLMLSSGPGLVLDEFRKTVKEIWGQDSGNREGERAKTRGDLGKARRERRKRRYAVSLACLSVGDATDRYRETREGVRGLGGRSSW